MLASEKAKPLSAEDISYRKIFAIAVPMIVAYITIPLMGMVDMAIVGHLDDPKYLGGTALGAVFFSTTYFIFFFLRWSTTGLTAQLFGTPDSAERSREIGETLARTMVLALAIAIIVLIAQRPLLSFALDLMKADPGVREQAIAYCTYRVLGAPAVLLVFALTGWFIGAAEPKAVLALTLISNAVNTLLAISFVYGLGMKADGCGLATALAEWSALAVGSFLFLRRHRAYLRAVTGAGLFDGAKLRRLALSNAEIAVKLVTTIAVMYGLMVQSTRLGPVTLAANALLLQLFYFASYILDGFANACEALSGRAFAGGNLSLLRTVTLRCGICALGVASVFLISYGFGGSWILTLLSNLPEVRAAAGHYLVWAAIMPMGMALAVMLEGVFVGMMRTDALRNCSIIGALVYFAMIVPATTHFGNHGVWFAFVSYFLARQIWGFIVFQRATAPVRSWTGPGRASTRQ